MKNIPLLSSFCLILLFCVEISAQSFTITRPETELTLEKEAFDLKGTLMEPAVSTTPHLVVIISGSGPTDRNGNNATMVNNSLKYLAEGLFDTGLASFRFDKRGIAESATDAIDEEDQRFEDFSNDVVDWIAYINKDNRFEKISIIGHSEGSLVGILAAQKVDLYKFVSLSGAGYPIDEIIKEQLKAQPQMVIDAAFPILDTLKSGVLVKNPHPMLASLFRPTVQPYLISWMKYDPAKELTKVSAPILIIQGDNDIQVPTENAARLHTEVPNAQMEIVEGMNHVLKITSTDYSENISAYNDPDLVISPVLMEKLTTFLKD